MPEEKDKTVPSSGSIFNSEPEDQSKEPKPTILTFSDKVSPKNDSELERKPTLLKFPSKATPEPEPTEERKPTMLVFPSKAGSKPDLKTVEERTPTRLVFPVKQSVPEKKPTQLAFPVKVKFAVVERTPVILFTNSEIKKRLRISNGELAELFPNVAKDTLNAARRMVLTQDLTGDFSNLCMKWGVGLQQRAADLSQKYADIVNSDIISTARKCRDQIFQGLSDLQFNQLPKRSWLQDLVDYKTPKELFQERYSQVQQQIAQLQQLFPKLSELQQDIKRAADGIDAIEVELSVHVIAGQLLEFRTMLGDVKVKGDPTLMRTDLDVLKRRLASLNETIGNLEALKLQQQVLYSQMSDLLVQTQDVLLVELPGWYRTMIGSGFKTDSTVDANANWAVISEIQKKLK